MGQTPEEHIVRLERRLERERHARHEAEVIAERTTSALYDRQRELELLESVATASNRARTLEEALDVALVRLCEHAGFPLGHAYLATSTGLVSAKTWHMHDPVRFDEFRRVSERWVFELGEGLPGRVLAAAAPIWIEEITADPEFPRRAYLTEHESVRSAFAFPVLAGSEVVAVIELFNDSATALDETLLAIAGQVGTQLGRVVERSRARDEIAHQAMHDGLTGLPNRLLLLDRIGLAQARAGRTQGMTGLLCIDLDHFKNINDSHGTTQGDGMLRQVAQRLRDAVPDGDTVARMGGDEFVVLCEDLRDERDALIAADRVQLALLTPFKTDDGEQHLISASIGIALDPTGELSADALLGDGDVAMYRAKDLGGGRHELFDDGLRERLQRRARIEKALRRALSAGELLLHYQPVVELEQRRIVGVEALIRWEDPERGMVSPGEFIPLAEEIGLIGQIGDWVLGEACRQAALWREELGELAPLPINVNVAASQLAEGDFVETVRGALQTAGIEPGDIALELTESALIESTELASEVLAELRALGIAVLLDDFGTGFSSLGYLQRFPIDELKIDRSFVSGFGEQAESSALVGAIVGMGQALGIGTVAEGIETEGQALEATRLGCDYGQGFLFARPAPAAAIADLVRTPFASRREAG